MIIRSVFGSQQGFAFVRFKTEYDANRIVETLDGTHIGGNLIQMAE